jgi:hypothetical protein
MNRRAFLRCFGGALLALPSLEACSRVPSSEPAERTGKSRGALTGSYAKRFVGFGVWDGIVPGLWYPQGGTETSFRLNQMVTDLTPHQANVLMMKGIDNVAAEHTDGTNGHAEGVQSLFSGTSPVENPVGSNNWDGTGQSVDQAIADALTKNGVLTRFASLQMGNAGSYSGLSFKAAKQPLGAESDPQALFNLMFQDAQLGAEAAKRASARRQSVLDGATADYQAISNKVSGEDKKRIDAHLQAIRDLEVRLAVAASCDPKSVTPDGTDFGTRWRSYLDLTVLALSCDLTRVVTMSFDHGGGGGTQFPWIGVYDDYHELSHQAAADYYNKVTDGAGTAKFLKVKAWFSQELARFVGQLKAITTPDGGTLFDETVLVQGSELGFDHTHIDVPFLILAGDKTPFRTGRYVNFAPNRPLYIDGAQPYKEYDGGIPHNKLLVTLLHAFGINATSFGSPDIGSGDLDAQLLKS